MKQETKQEQEIVLNQITEEQAQHLWNRYLEDVKDYIPLHTMTEEEQVQDFMSWLDFEVQTQHLLQQLIMKQDQKEVHNHSCECCGTVWGHTGMSAGNKQEHMCPSCNTGPYWFRT